MGSHSLHSVRGAVLLQGAITTAFRTGVQVQVVVTVVVRRLWRTLLFHCLTTIPVKRGASLPIVSQVVPCQTHVMSFRMLTMFSFAWLWPYLHMPGVSCRTHMIKGCESGETECFSQAWRWLSLSLSSWGGVRVCWWVYGGCGGGGGQAIDLGSKRQLVETLTITVLPKPNVYAITDETYAPFGLAGLPAWWGNQTITLRGIYTSR